MPHIIGTTTLLHRKRDENERGLVANLPVEYLSIFGLAMREVDVSPTSIISGQGRRLLADIPEVDRHGECGQLEIGHFPIETRIDDESDFLLIELAAITLLLNQICECRFDEFPCGDCAFLDGRVHDGKVDWESAQSVNIKRIAAHLSSLFSE
jgi:hypothetical protein